MRSIATYLPAIACGAMMLLICIPMLRGRKQDQTSDDSSLQQEVAELRDEISRLKAERAVTDRSEALDG